MSKEKKKQASMTELSSGSCLFLLFSPLIIFAYGATILGSLSFLILPESPFSNPEAGIPLIILFVFMSYVLFRYVVRWRRLALFIKRVRDEYFRFMRMQENADDTEPVAEEGSDDDMAAYLGYEDEQQRGLSQS